MPPSGVSAKSNDRSNIAAEWPTGSGRPSRSPSRHEPPEPGRKDTMVWNSGCRPNDRTGFTASTTNSNGTS